VPTRPLNPLPLVFEAARRALERAGYDYEEIARMSEIDPKVLLQNQQQERLENNRD
jgi:hypothetical protein